MIVQIKRIADSEKVDRDGKHWKVIYYDNKDGKEIKRDIFRKFEDKYNLLVEGATIELELEPHGQFHNVIGIKEATLQEAVKKEETSQYAFKYHEQMQMNRRTALMQACAVSPNKTALPILTLAETFINWLEKGEVPEKETQVQKIEQSAKVTEAPKMSTNEHKTDTIENLGQLFLYLTKTFKILPTRVLKLYSCKDNEALQKYLTDNKISYQDVIEQVKQLKESAK